MNNTKNAVMIALFASMQSGAKHYTKAGVKKLLELLAKYHDIHVQRRWLFYCLANMEGAGLIRRKERYHRRPDGSFVQLSSMITFTLAGARYLVKKRVIGAMGLLKSILAFISGRDKRWPNTKDVAPTWNPEEAEANKRRARALLVGIG